LLIKQIDKFGFSSFAFDIAAALYRGNALRVYVQTKEILIERKKLRKQCSVFSNVSQVQKREIQKRTAMAVNNET
jgi:FMN phosphatase YigB (HAD superfamily)